MNASGWSRSPSAPHADPSRDAPVLTAVLLFLAGHVLIWVTMATFSFSSPPWDDIEQLVWSRSLEWGYYKHPPAPTWWISGWVAALGRQVWVTYLAGQVAVAGALLVVWLIGLQCTTPARSFAAMVLTALVGYYGYYGLQANHDTLQLLPVAVFLWSVLLAVQSPYDWRRTFLWSLVGAAAALAFLSKYSALVWFAVTGLWLAWTPAMHSWRAWRGVGVAALVFGSLVAPHLVWLVDTDFLPLRYASEQFINNQQDMDTADLAWFGHVIGAFKFIRNQGEALVAPLLAWGLLRWWARRSSPPNGRAAVATDNTSFLWWMGLAPFGVVVLLGLAGMGLVRHWATTFFLFSGLLLVRWLPAVNPRQLVRRALVIGLCLDLLLAGVSAYTRVIQKDHRGRAAKTLYPVAALTRALQSDWQAQMRQPVTLIAGETWLAGSVAVALPTQPLVLVDAMPERSPWIDAAALAHCDLVVLIDRGTEAPPQRAEIFELLERASVQGEVALPWTTHPDGPQVRVQWAIVRAGCWPGRQTSSSNAAGVTDCAA